VKVKRVVAFLHYKSFDEFMEEFIKPLKVALGNKYEDDLTIWDAELFIEKAGAGEFVVKIPQYDKKDDKKDGFQIAGVFKYPVIKYQRNFKEWRVNWDSQLGPLFRAYNLGVSHPFVVDRTREGKGKGFRLNIVGDTPDTAGLNIYPYYIRKV